HSGKEPRSATGATLAAVLAGAFVAFGIIRASVTVGASQHRRRAKGWRRQSEHRAAASGINGSGGIRQIAALYRALAQSEENGSGGEKTRVGSPGASKQAKTPGCGARAEDLSAGRQE